MLPAFFDFGPLHRGDSTTALAVVMESGGEPAFIAAGATARCQIRDLITGGLLLEWSTADDSILLVDGGALLQPLPPRLTNGLRPDQYQAELEISESSGLRRSWLRGPITVMADVAGSATGLDDIGGSPTPVYFDFGTFLRGDSTWPIAVVINLGDAPAWLAAGASALCQARDPKTDALVLAWSTADGSILLVDGGALLHELPPAATEDASPAQLSCELEITESTGRRRTWLRGPLTIAGDVARGE
ncbi:hypothetical protein [Nevskia sp.]|uniref:hypothetical protein n=1 Tax=Nevskia sp. TaxID=1929292 RepID=UPI003F71492F